MNSSHVVDHIKQALAGAKISQRKLADMTEISQPTLSRIISGDRTAKMPELIRIAQATGTTVSQLTGASDIPGRVQYAARSTNDSSMEAMRRKLLHFIELNDYLDDQGIAS